MTKLDTLYSINSQLSPRELYDTEEENVDTDEQSVHESKETVDDDDETVDEQMDTDNGEGGDGEENY